MASKKIKRAKTKSRFSALSDNSKVFIKTQILAAVLYGVAFIIASVAGLAMNISKSYAFYVCIFAFASSSFVCAMFAGYKIHKNGISVGLIYCLPFNVVVTFASIVANSFKIDLTAAISFFILIVSSMLGGIFSVNIRIKVKPKRK